MRVKPIIRNGGEAALALLRLTHAAADVFPPLKGAAGVALHISDMVTVRYNLKHWHSLTVGSRNSIPISKTGPSLASMSRIL